MFCDGPNGGSLRCVHQNCAAKAVQLPWPCWSSVSRALPELWSKAAAYGGQASSRALIRYLFCSFRRGHAKGATWTLACASETPLSISTEAWEDTCEAELCLLCGCGKRKRNPGIIYERQFAKKCKILAQKLQARKKKTKKKTEARPKISSAASSLSYLSSLFHHRPPSLIHIIHASS